MSRRSRKNHRTAPTATNNKPVRDEQTQNQLEIRRTEVGSLSSARLELDYTYQRPTEPERVRSIVSQFDPALVNLLKVSARDGHYYVFDGGHTLAALRTVNGKKDFPVLCKIYYGLTYEEEAVLFAKQQGNAKKVGIPYKLRALEAAGDLETVDFLERTRKSGFEIAPGSRVVRDGNISAVKRAYDAYKQLGAERYEELMRLVKETWNGEAWSVGQSMMGGLYEFYRTYGNVIRESRFVSKLAGVSRNAIDREASSYYGVSASVAYALAIGKFYNRGGGYGTVDLALLTLSPQPRGRKRSGDHERAKDGKI